MASVEISPEHNKVVKQFAQDWGCTADEAAERLITTAAGRLAATRKYAQKEGGRAKPAKPKAAKKAAKGPIARKAKGAAKKAKAPKAAPAAEAQA